jgi:hypothetical protein
MVGHKTIVHGSWVLLCRGATKSNRCANIGSIPLYWSRQRRDEDKLYHALHHRWLDANKGVLFPYHLAMDKQGGKTSMIDKEGYNLDNDTMPIVYKEDTIFNNVELIRPCNVWLEIRLWGRFMGTLCCFYNGKGECFLENKIDPMSLIINGDQILHNRWTNLFIFL